jgi:hypothetical protein
MPTTILKKLAILLVSSRRPSSRDYSSGKLFDWGTGPTPSKHKEALERCKEIESKSSVVFTTYVRDPKTGGGKKLKQPIPRIRKAVGSEEEKNTGSSRIDGEHNSSGLGRRSDRDL